jgi:hypothetical protein
VGCEGVSEDECVVEEKRSVGHSKRRGDYAGHAFEANFEGDQN